MMPIAAMHRGHAELTRPMQPVESAQRTNCVAADVNSAHWLAELTAKMLQSDDDSFDMSIKTCKLLCS